MANEKTISLKDMRSERDISQAVYIQFLMDRKNSKTHIFCFYKEEDGKYYNPRIEQKFDKYFCYEVKNKMEVLKLLDRLTSTDLYSDTYMLFFVDREYENGLNNKEELFETPCYSIENLYVQKECLGNVLQLKFGLSETDKDYEKCLHDFELRENEFNSQILEFNALAYLRREKEYSTFFDSIETSNIINVKVDKVSQLPRYNKMINKIKEKYKFNVKEIEYAKKELINNGNVTLNFRGKNQLHFFVEFIKDLRRLNNIGGYFSGRWNNVNIDITKNCLSELSQCALTPHSLDVFLEKHKEKFSKLKIS